MKNKAMIQKRTDLCLAQEDVARMAKLTLRHYLRIENGLHAPNIYMALNIAAALKCDVNELFSTKINTI